MRILQVGIIGLIGVILALSIKKNSPQIAMLLSLAIGIIIMFNILPSLSAIIEIFKDLSQKIQIDFKYIGRIIKIIGIAYISEFCGQICVDAGETAVASKIEIAAKVFMISASLPIITGLIESINFLLS